MLVAMFHGFTNRALKTIPTDPRATKIRPTFFPMIPIIPMVPNGAWKAVGIFLVAPAPPQHLQRLIFEAQGILLQLLFLRGAHSWPSSKRSDRSSQAAARARPEENHLGAPWESPQSQGQAVAQRGAALAR